MLASFVELRVPRIHIKHGKLDGGCEVNERDVSFPGILVKLIIFLTRGAEHVEVKGKIFSQVIKLGVDGSDS